TPFRYPGDCGGSAGWVRRFYGRGHRTPLTGDEPGKVQEGQESAQMIKPAILNRWLRFFGNELPSSLIRAHLKKGLERQGLYLDGEDSTFSEILNRGAIRNVFCSAFSWSSRLSRVVFSNRIVVRIQSILTSKRSFSSSLFFTPCARIFS